jgi:plastocyanin
MNRTRTLGLGIAALLLAAGPAACGGDEEPAADQTPETNQGGSTEPSGTTPDPTASETTGGTDSSTIKLSADPSGALRYEQPAVDAKAGELTLEFTNEASVPHDVKIEDAGEEIGGTDDISNDTVSTKLDLKPGRYTFYCSVGGHREAGMEGTLNVE